MQIVKENTINKIQKCSCGSPAMKHHTQCEDCYDKHFKSDQHKAVIGFGLFALVTSLLIATIRAYGSQIANYVVNFHNQLPVFWATFLVMMFMFLIIFLTTATIIKIMNKL